MSEDPLISIIVPIYKVEQYLKRCVDSLRNQTYTNLEILLIDDGSPDRCGKICDEYAKADRRIKVVHKQNGGPSDARNVGLDVMKGEYVSCVDSDDFVSRYYIENLWMAIQKGNCLLSECSFVEYCDDDRILSPKKIETCEIEILDKKELYSRLLYQKGIDFSSWGKLYHRDLFQEVRYPVGQWYEDVPTTFKIFEKIDKIAVIPNVDYYYYQSRDSITHVHFDERKMDAIRNVGALRDFISVHYPSLKRAAECRYFSTVCTILFQINDQKYEQQKLQLWNEIKKYRRSVLLDKNGRKKARLAAMLSYAGHDIMKFLYRITQRI